MKLYVTSPKTGKKISLMYTGATTKNIFYENLGSTKFKLGDEEFHINDVFAGHNSSQVGLMFGGGIIGIFGGPFGIIIGALIGLWIAIKDDRIENLNVKMFNDSILTKNVKE